MSSNNSETFLNEIRIDPNKQRLYTLKRRLDDCEIEVEAISKEDVEELIKLYDSEVKSIRDETNKIKNKIKQELEQLRGNIAKLEI
ncbi:MAG: hypothetical protein IJH12_08640 [Clostridia bacterium]|nr:hypothetical protein [Clostridia bacterium]